MRFVTALELCDREVQLHKDEMLRWETMRKVLAPVYHDLNQER